MKYGSTGAPARFQQAFAISSIEPGFAVGAEFAPWQYRPIIEATVDGVERMSDRFAIVNMLSCLPSVTRAMGEA
jgi:hypothetical protein